MRHRFLAVSTALFVAVSGWSAPAGAHAGAELTPPKLAPTVERADLRFPEPTPVATIYEAWSEAFGIQVLFDPKLKSPRIVLGLEDVTAEESLAFINLFSQHFSKILNEKTILIADNTPQNRRTYSTQTIRTFALRHLSLQDALNTIRSILGAKTIAAQEELRTVTLRDDTVKVELAERLLSSLDKPRSEVAIDVEVLHLAPRGRAAFLKAAPKDHSGGGLPRRLDERQLARLRKNATVLARPGLTLLGGDTGSLSLADELTRSVTGDEVLYHRIGLDLEVRARTLWASDEIELDLELAVSDATEGDRPLVGRRQLKSSARLGSGETHLWSGFLWSGGRAGGPESGGSWLLSRFERGKDAERGEVVVATTARILGEPGFSESDLAGFCVGTEANLGFCLFPKRGRRPL